MMDNKTEQLNIMRLCSAWLHFLDHAGKYAARYYMSRDLELPPSEQDPATHTAMVKHYGTEKNLLGTIQRDLGTFPEELKAINAAQIACELPGFSERDEYLAQIVMGFTMLDRHGKERRAYYRRIVNKDLKTLNGGGATYGAFSQPARGWLQRMSEKSRSSSGQACASAAVILPVRAGFVRLILLLIFRCCGIMSSTRRNISAKLLWIKN